MKKYMVIYHAPSGPEENMPPSETEMKAVMGAWMAWGEKYKNNLVDFGTPLSGGLTVTPSTTATSKKEVVGYSILQGSSGTEVANILKEHPHMNMPGGCSIEVHEMQPIPM